jgi:hypothetical protein
MLTTCALGATSTCCLDEWRLIDAELNAGVDRCYGVACGEEGWMPTGGCGPKWRGGPAAVEAHRRGVERWRGSMLRSGMRGGGVDASGWVRSPMARRPRGGRGVAAGGCPSRGERPLRWRRRVAGGQRGGIGRSGRMAQWRTPQQARKKVNASNFF